MRYGGSSIPSSVEALGTPPAPRDPPLYSNTLSYGTYVDTPVLNRMMFTFNIAWDCFFFDRTRALTLLWFYSYLFYFIVAFMIYYEIFTMPWGLVVLELLQRLAPLFEIVSQ